MQTRSSHGIENKAFETQIPMTPKTVWSATVFWIDVGKRLLKLFFILFKMYFSKLFKFSIWRKQFFLKFLTILYVRPRGSDYCTEVPDLFSSDLPGTPSQNPDRSLPNKSYFF